MKRLTTILLAAVLVNCKADARAQQKEEPALATADRRLAELLRPEARPSFPFANEPKARQATWWIEHPQAPLPPLQILPPHIVLPTPTLAVPPHPLEGIPLAHS